MKRQNNKNTGIPAYIILMDDGGNVDYKCKLHKYFQQH